MGLTEMARRRPRRGYPRRTAVYEVYGASGRFLYAGTSADPERRLGDHRRYAPWWREVHRINVEWYADQWIAADVETFLVRTADPAYNIQCRGGPWQRNPAMAAS